MIHRILVLALLGQLLSGSPLGNSLGGGPPKATYTAHLGSSALPLNQTAVVAVVIDVPSGFHIQSHQPLADNLIKLQVTPDPTPGIEYLDPVYPPPAVENFPGLGNQSVYEGRVIVYLPLRVKPDATVGDITLSGKLTWQSCDKKVCYAPERNRPFSLDSKIVRATESVAPGDPATFSGFDPSVFARQLPAATPPHQSNTSIEFFGTTFSLGASNWALALLVALAVGVLFNLMPCVLPVVPLKAIGFFEVSRQNRAKCFALGIVFSLGVISIFAALATLIIIFRKFAWGQEFQYGWFIWSMVAILVLMALGMFGLFEVVLPKAVYNITPNHESWHGNYFFGMLTAVLSTPCTAPMFAGLLAWSLAQTKTLGTVTIIMVGVGMALPYLLLSAFPALANRVPRTGPWSAVLKQMMGFLVLAVAVYFAGGRLAIGKEFFWAVFAVVAVAMIFLIFRTSQLTPRPMPIVVATICSIVVIALSLNITLRLLGGLEWKPYSDQALANARASGDPVLVEFTANWCGNCLALEGSVYHSGQTAAAIKDRHVILLRADLTEADAPGTDMVSHYNPGGGIPLTVIYGPGKSDPITLTSLYTVQNLLDALNRATSSGS